MPDALDLTPQLLEDHGRALRALARSLLRDRDAAEDVVQDTWLTAMRQPPRSRESLGGWLRTVVWTLALKRRRSEERRARRERACARSEHVDGPGGNGGTDELDPEERARVVRVVTDAVLALEEPYRTTVLARFFQDLPPREIARRQGIPVATVKSRLRRAHARLRRRLQPDLERDGIPWTRSLAILFSLPRIPTPVTPAPESSAPVGPAGAIGSAGTALPLTAVMAGKTKLIAVGGLLGLLGLLVWRVSAAPPELDPLTHASRVRDEVLQPALLAPERVPDPARPEEQREEVDVAAQESGERVWPGAHLPGPGFLYSLTVLIVDEDDLPVPGARIYLGPLAHPLNAIGETNAAGRFQVRWFGRRPSMEVALCVRGPDQGAGVIQLLRLSQGVEHALRATVNQEVGVLTVAPRSREIDSGVTSLALPLALNLSSSGSDGAYVEPGTFSVVYSSSAASPLDAAPEALHDPEGFVHFVGLEGPAGCPVGLYRMQGLHAYRTAAVRALVDQKLTLDATLRTENLLQALVLFQDGEFSFVEGGSDSKMVRAAGVVRDASGAPVPGAVVCTLGETGEVLERVAADEDGAFLFEELPPGPLRLRAGGGDHGLASGSFVAPEGSTLTWSPYLDRGHEVTGRLIDANGGPLSDWTVVLVGSDPVSRWNDVTTTAEDGSFSVPNLPYQAFRLLASVADAQGPPDVVLEDVWPGTPLEPIRVDANGLPRGSLAFTVEDPDGHPLPDARVRLWHRAAGGGTWIRPADGEAGFRMEGLPEGSYRLEIGTRRHGWRELPEIWIGAGEDVHLGRVTLAMPARLGIEARADDPASLEGAVFEIWHEHADVRRRVRSIEGTGPPLFLLPPGDYVATVRSRQGSNAIPVALAPGGGAALRLDFARDSVGMSEVPLEPASYGALLSNEAIDAQSCAACHTEVELR